MLLPICQMPSATQVNAMTSRHSTRPHQVSLPSITVALSRWRRGACPVVRCFQDGNAATKNDTVRISLRLPYRTAFGQALGIVGAGGLLGDWNPSNAIVMQWTAGDMWAVDLSIDARQPVLQLEYKYVVLDNNGLVTRWKPGENFRVDVPVRDSNQVAGSVLVRDAWDGDFRQVDVHVLVAKECEPTYEEVAASAAAPALPAAADYLCLPEGREQAVIKKAADRALEELKAALAMHQSLLLRSQDPADMEVLLADRKLAAASSKLVAYGQALKTADVYARLPASAPHL